MNANDANGRSSGRFPKIVVGREDFLAAKDKMSSLATTFYFQLLILFAFIRVQMILAVLFWSCPPADCLTLPSRRSYKSDSLMYGKRGENPPLPRNCDR